MQTSSTSSLLEQVSVILVGVSHPGNIGSAARAMKVMGLSQLVLVSPQCEVDEQTLALASGAADIASSAQVFSTLEEAVSECSLVVGASARSRTLDWPMLTARECGLKVVESAQHSKVALVFGRERTGLTNDELHLCHYHVFIPANPEYSSLNLAMAVQTISYEVRMAWLASLQLHQSNLHKLKVDASKPDLDIENVSYPRHKELEMFYQHLEKTLYRTQFLSKEKPSLVITKLRRLFNRARPETQEINILRGFLASIDKTLDDK